MSFLTEIVRLMWCVKGVKINTLVVLGFGWPVEVFFGLLSVSEINIKYVYRVLACLVGLTHGCVNFTQHVLWYVLIGYLG